MNLFLKCSLGDFSTSISVKAGRKTHRADTNKLSLDLVKQRLISDGLCTRHLRTPQNSSVTLFFVRGWMMMMD